MTKEQFEEIIALNDAGRMKHRESKKLEFKANFNIGSMNVYSKTFAAFANNVGGVVVFGVLDRPRLPIGTTNNNFYSFDGQEITNYLNEHFAPMIDWESYDFEINNKRFGVILIHESKNKPIMCKKETRGDTSREGDIFFRYSGRSERIKYPELNFLLQESREAEQRKWMELIENIAEVGPRNIMLMDVLRGEIPSNSDAKIIIDKELLDKIKFVQEGHFVEHEGAPALKLIGTVEGVETVVPDFSLEEDFYTATELGERLGLLTNKRSTVYVTAVIWRFGLTEQSKYFQEKRGLKYYSKLALELLESKKITLEEAKQIMREYNMYKRNTSL